MPRNSKRLGRLRRFVYEKLEDRQLLTASPSGPEFLANTYLTGEQIDVATAMDADGDSVVVWQSSGQDGSGEGIYAQRYNTAGAAVGGEFRVNTNTADNQTVPAVSMDANGNFVVAWQGLDSSTSGIFARRYNSAGVAQGDEFAVNATTLGPQTRPAVALDADGDFVIAWQGPMAGGSRDEIVAQRYNAAGVAQGAEFQVNTNTSNEQVHADVAIGANGDFVVVWDSIAADGSPEIYGQRYNAAGVVQGSEFRANTYTADRQINPTAAMDADGDFVVIWQSDLQDGKNFGIYGQRFNAAGIAQGVEFRVNTHTIGNEKHPDVAMQANGDFVVVWTSNPQDRWGDGIYAQAYTAAGAPSGGEFRVNSTQDFEERFASIGMNASGDFLVAWQAPEQGSASSGIYAQRYDRDAELGMVSATANGQATITIEYTISDRRAQPFDVSVYRSVDAVFGGDVLTGSIKIDAPADLEIGLHNKVVVIGSGVGQLALPGAGAADVAQDYFLLVVADPTDNIPEPNNANNTSVFAGSYYLPGGKVFVHGGSGVDTVAVAPSSANTKVTINSIATLYASADVAGVDIRGHAGNDKLTASATLSKPLSLFGGDGNDTLTGAAAADAIFGGAGNDKINGGLGNDSLDGEAGMDTWSYAGTNAADFIDLDWDALASSLVLDRRNSVNTLLETDRAKGIETLSIMAQAGDDDVDLSLLSAADRTAAGVTKVTLDGGAGADVLRGSGGADTIKGGSGVDNDTLYGGDGADTLDGGTGNDTLYGEAGADKLYGRDGNDSLNAGSDGLAELVDGGLGIDTCFFWAEENDVNCEIFK